MYVNTVARYYYSEGECCSCCSAEVCGVLRPDWLVQGNATYLGIAVINGYEAMGWVASGDQDRYFWQEYDGTPLELSVKAGGQSLGEVQYDPSSYARSINPWVFDMPASCQSAGACPATSLCGKI